MAHAIPKPGHRRLSPAANLSSLLPTGTLLAFQALIPSFSNNGTCLTAHKYLTLSIIIGFSLVCFLSSFTDSFEADGKVYYGIATPTSFLVFNEDDDKDDNKGNDDEEKGDSSSNINIKNDKQERKKERKKILHKYRIKMIDFLHALCSLLVFFVFATSSSDVQHCFFPHATANGTALMMNLPLMVSAAVSSFFMLFPTRRRGIGHVDTAGSRSKK